MDRWIYSIKLFFCREALVVYHHGDSAAGFEYSTGEHVGSAHAWSSIIFSSLAVCLQYYHAHTVLAAQ